MAEAADALVIAVPSAAARMQGTQGMVFPELSEPAARGLPGVAAHREMAEALLPVLRGLVRTSMSAAAVTSPAATMPS